MVELEHLIGSRQGDLVLPIEPVRGRLGLIRGQIRRFLDDHAIDDDAWLLVTNELVANAVDAATGGAGSAGVGSAGTAGVEPGPEPPSILLSLGADQLRVQLTVANVGPAFELPDPAAMPAPGASRGRGLPLVLALVDDLAVRRVDGVNVVTCWRPRPAGGDR